MELITSPGNARVKRIRALRDRTERDRTGLFYAEGLRVVLEALQVCAAVETLIVAPVLLTSAAAVRAVDEARRRGVSVVTVTPGVFRSLSRRDNPCGLAAVVRQRWHALDALDAGDGCWVALEGVQDPGNLGTILRSCDAVGAAGVILLGPGTDPYHPTAVRASTGAVFSQRLVRASADELLAWARGNGGTLIGASGAGDRDYRAVAYRQPLVLLLGAERTGLSATLLQHCDAVARIPMVGRVDSLNLGVAASLLLYEALRDRNALTVEALGALDSRCERRAES